jgi:hypothetical protein
MSIDTQTTSAASSPPARLARRPGEPADWSTWNRTCEMCPDLRAMHDIFSREIPPPKPIGDAEFLRLIACLVDPRKRAILRVLLFELLSDDLAELLSDETEGANHGP